jgi:nitroreductase
MRTADALALVAAERERQERLKDEGRFVATCADPEMTDAEKLCVLVEEVGEAAKEVVTLPERQLASDSLGSRENLRKELIQVAAVAVAFVESLL